MIPIGMPTLVEAPTPELSAVLANSLGLDFVELNQNLPACQSDSLDPDGLISLKRKYGVFFTLHLDEQLDVCCFNRRVGDAWLEGFADSLRLARKIGAPIVNMHLADGVYFTLPGERVYLYSKHEKYWFERLHKFIEAAERELSGCGTIVCIENTNGWKPFQLRGIEMLLESDKFALTLDIGHSASSDRTDEPFIFAGGRDRHKLIHMHIHDASGKSNHLPLGGGELDLAHYFGIAREYYCRAVIEVKTADALKRSVEYARERELM